MDRENKFTEALDWLWLLCTVLWPVPMLAIGLLWLMKWLVDTYLFAVLLIFAGIVLLLMLYCVLYCAVGFVVSIATIIAGKD